VMIDCCCYSYWQMIVEFDRSVVAEAFLLLQKTKRSKRTFEMHPVSLHQHSYLNEPHKTKPQQRPRQRLVFEHLLLVQMWVTRIDYSSSTVAVVVFAFVIVNERGNVSQTWNYGEIVVLNGLATELGGDGAHGKDMPNKRLNDMLTRTMAS